MSFEDAAIMTGAQPSITATLELIRQEVSADSPILAQNLQPAVQRNASGFSQLLQAAEADPAAPASYALSLEYIFEGYLLHYADSRLFRAAEPGFALLAGDYMFAKGLGYIAAQQDSFAIRLLADLIGLCSLLHSRSPDPEIALALWMVASLSLRQRISEGSANASRPAEIAGWHSFKQSAWSETVDADRLNEIIAALLSGLPPERRRQITGELDKISTLFFAS